MRDTNSLRFMSQRAAEDAFVDQARQAAELEMALRDLLSHVVPVLGEHDRPIANAKAILARIDAELNQAFRSLTQARGAE
jgi:hypothetical protein